jgi:hypothetical protein
MRTQYQRQHQHEQGPALAYQHPSTRKHTQSHTRTSTRTGTNTSALPHNRPLAKVQFPAKKPTLRIEDPIEVERDLGRQVHGKRLSLVQCEVGKRGVAGWPLVLQVLQVLCGAMCVRARE